MGQGLGLGEFVNSRRALELVDSFSDSSDEEAIATLVQAIIDIAGLDDDLLAEASDLLADGGV